MERLGGGGGRGTVTSLRRHVNRSTPAGYHHSYCCCTLCPRICWLSRCCRMTDHVFVTRLDCCAVRGAH
eukprot:gene13649-biopygen12567